MLEEKFFLGVSAASTTYHFRWCFRASHQWVGTSVLCRVHVASCSFSHGDRPMLSILPLFFRGRLQVITDPFTIE